MPAGFWHAQCAERALTVSGVKVPLVETYRMGAQGPDPLFMLGIYPLRPASKPLPYGNVLHQTRTGAFLCTLLTLSENSSPQRKGTVFQDSAASRSFAMGFLTHYALDSTVHPFVYENSFARGGRYSSSIHMRLEKRWDARMYRALGLPGTPVNMPGIAEARAYWPAIAGAWAHAASIVYPEQQITASMLMDAFAAADRTSRLTHSERGLKYAAMWCVERMIGRPRLVTAHMTPRFIASDDPTYAPAVALFDTAVQRAAEYLRAADAFFAGRISREALADAIGNLGYDTGKPSKP